MKYDFKCPKCGNIIEVEMTVDEYETLSVNCPEDDEEMVRTYSSLPNFVIKKDE